MCAKFKLLLLNLLFVQLGFPASRELRFVNARLVELDSKKILEVEVSNNGDNLLTPIVWADVYVETGEYLGRFDGDFLQIYPNTFETCRIDLSRLHEGKFKALVVGQYVSDESSTEFAKATSITHYLVTVQPNNDGKIGTAPPGYDYDTEAEAVMPDLAENNFFEKTTAPNFAVSTKESTSPKI